MKNYTGSHLAQKPEKRKNTRPTTSKNRKLAVKRKKRAAKRSFVVIGVVFLLVAVILVGLLFALFMNYSSKLNREVLPDRGTETGLSEAESAVTGTVSDSSKPGSAVVGEVSHASDGVTNILLIGVDNDNAAGMDKLGNADGIIMVSINKDTKEIVLTSFMRDIKVELPDGSHTKLTSSYHKGGTSMLIKAIEQNFGVPVDNYALVNYLSVVEIVDAVGGITVDVSAEELYHMEIKIRNINGLLGLDPSANMIPPEKAGTLTLNGVQTAAYLRIRMAGNNDVERTERARNVLLKLKDKLLDMNASELNKFADTALPCITTDMGSGDILKLMFKAASYLKYEMLSGRVPLDDSFHYSNDSDAYVIIDFDMNREALKNTIYK